MVIERKARAAEEDAARPTNNRYIVTLLAISCLVTGHLLSFKSELGKHRAKSWSPYGEPKPLLNYGQFRMLYPLEGAPTLVELSDRNLFFTSDLIEIGRVNLATLSRRQTYFIQQTPAKSDRTTDEQLQLNDLLRMRIDIVAEGDAGTAAASASVGKPVASGAKSPKLEKQDPLISYFTKVFRDKDNYEIPSFPLDEQPDPEKVTHIDADQRLPCASGIRKQKLCGACYAFSWVSLVEWHYCRQTGRAADLSEQYLVDCGHRAHMKGCTSGFLKDAKDFSHAYGMFTEQEYPYVAKENKCRAEYGSWSISVKEWNRLQIDRKNWEEVLKEQPIIVEVNSPSDMESYSRGIHPGHNCNKRLEHGMLLVGHGRQNGQPYWILKNWRGKSWGENGYFRLSRDAPLDKCIPNAYTTKIKFENVDESDYAGFYDSLQYKPSLLEYSDAEKRAMASKRAEQEAKRSSLGGKIMSFFGDDE